MSLTVANDSCINEPESCWNFTVSVSCTSPVIFLIKTCHDAVNSGLPSSNTSHCASQLSSGPWTRCQCYGCHCRAEWNRSATCSNNCNVIQLSVPVVLSMQNHVSGEKFQLIAWVLEFNVVQAGKQVRRAEAYETMRSWQHIVGRQNWSTADWLPTARVNEEKHLIRKLVSCRFRSTFAIRMLIVNYIVSEWSIALKIKKLKYHSLIFRVDWVVPVFKLLFKQSLPLLWAVKPSLTGIWPESADNWLRTCNSSPANGLLEVFLNNPGRHA